MPAEAAGASEIHLSVVVVVVTFSRWRMEQTTQREKELVPKKVCNDEPIDLKYKSVPRGQSDNDERQVEQR